MAKTYKLAPKPQDDEQKTITVTEVKEVTTETKTTVAQLRIQHAGMLERIEGLKAQSNEVVDQLQAINDNLTEIMVTDMPEKIGKAKK